MIDFRFYIILLCTLALSLTVNAQWAIKGKIYDREKNEPLPGANVYLLNHWDIGSSSGLEGDFYLSSEAKNLQSDTLVISFIGYHDELIPLLDWQNKTIYLRAKKDQLNEVVVLSTPLVSEEFQYEKINKIEIYTSPAAKADPLLAVNALPSATPVDESANISLRGGSPAQTGVFFNDVPIYDYVKFSQLNGIGVFSIFNTAIVKNLSVFPGNPPLEYGNVSSGMVSVISDDNVVQANSNSLTVSPASFGYFRQQKISDKAMVSLFFNYQPGGVLQAINGDALRGIDQFNLGDGGLYFLLRPSQNSLVKVFNYSLSESYRFNFRSASFNGFFNQRRKRNFSTLKMEQHFGNSVISLNSGFSISEATFDYSRFQTDASGSDFFLGLNYQYIGDKFQMKGGFSSDNRNSSTVGTAPAVSYALGENHPYLSFDRDGAINIHEGYLYGKYFPNNKLSIGGGLRFNPGIDTESYLSKQLNFKFDLNENLKVIMGAGKYHQALRELNFGRDFAVIASSQYSIDVKWSASNCTSSFSAFFKDNQGAPSLTNQISGIEIYFEKNIFERLKYDISATYLHIESDFTDVISTANDVSYFVRGNLNYNFSKRWIIGGNLIYREGNAYFPVTNAEFDEVFEVYRPFYSQETQQLPNYFSAGLSISNEYALSERMTVICFASVNNLTNHDNVRSFAYNSDYSESSAEYFSGRTFYFGAVFRF